MRAQLGGLSAVMSVGGAGAGAVVVELIPYNWHGTGFGEVYRNITTSTADVHHVAWRARHPRWALYNSTDDERYSSWTAKECESQYAPPPLFPGATQTR